MLTFLKYYYDLFEMIYYIFLIIDCLNIYYQFKSRFSSVNTPVNKPKRKYQQNIWQKV